MPRLFYLLLLLASAAPSMAQTAPPRVEYTREDSLEVVRLLADRTLKTPLDYARKLVGRPYVAHTLERGDEHLVVNLRGLDCATLVETASALAIAGQRAERAARQQPGGAPWATAAGSRQRNANDPWRLFCNALESIRYRGGHCTDYLSRLHYLTFWIGDHLRRGNISEVALPQKYSRQRTTDIHYMSQHADKYRGLKGEDDVRRIATLENECKGLEFEYLPQENCGLSRRHLPAIQDGDIVCIVTTKKGLDYSHQGLAFWGKDGKLHLLHASSEKGKVIADPRPIDQYLKGIRPSIGIRLFRLQTAHRAIRPPRPRTN